MLLSLKELLYVALIAAVIFWLARSVAAPFIDKGDYYRRRNAWFVLTIAAFISPAFWMYALAAIVTMSIAARREWNPAAMYLMVFQVIPPIAAPVTVPGLPYLFDLNNYLLVSFCVLVPAALRIRRTLKSARERGVAAISGEAELRPGRGAAAAVPIARRVDAMDVALLGYGLLTAVLYVHSQTPDGGLYPGSFTESLRRALVFFFATYIPYFVISRTSGSRKALLDTMATFCLNCCLMCAIAAFESARSWLLYGEMAERWGYGISFSLYVARGASIRAMASTGHSMALGYILVIALGFWLCLKTHVESRKARIAVTGLFWVGLLAAYTRGAWIGAVLVYFFYAALRPKAFSKLLKAATVAFAVGVVISFTPLAHRITSVIPFLGGTVDAENLVYRQRLFERSLQLIQESPLLGDQQALLKMQDLRQGQGIVDLVNAYAGVLLDNGLVGLTLFLFFILAALFKAWAVSRRLAKADPDLGLVGASLAASIMALLVLLENGSFGGAPEKVFYVLAALASAYAYFGRAAARPPLQAVASASRAASDAAQ